MRRALKGILLCLRASDGRELWRKEYGLDKVRMNTLNNYAGATPALDGEHVYLFWPGVDETTLTALTHDGREVWTAKLPGNRTQHGMGSSPIVVGEYVIVTREQDQKSGGNIASAWFGRGSQDRTDSMAVRASEERQCLVLDAVRLSGQAGAR